MKPKSSGKGILDTRVLVLNKTYLPIQVITVKRAFTLFFQGIVKAVDENYVTFDFESWSNLILEDNQDHIGTKRGAIRVPRVVILLHFDQVPKRQIKFSRMNVYARDNDTCQYCNKPFKRPELNLDHVTPRSRGGLSTWDNIVCSCRVCNKKKGGRTPEEAQMKLTRKPIRPQWSPIKFESSKYKEWLPFLQTVKV